MGELTTCNSCGSELDNLSQADCPVCDELSVPKGAICDSCDNPAEFQINGSPACESCHESAYPID